MREVILPSGAKLRVGLSKFADARSLYQAILEEAKSLKIDPETDIDTNLLKDLFCTGLSSKKIEVALWACMKDSLYEDARITESVFEPAEARGDYMNVCIEVTKENVLPFMKNLYAQYGDILGKITKSPA